MPENSRPRRKRRLGLRTCAMTGFSLPAVTNAGIDALIKPLGAASRSEVIRALVTRALQQEKIDPAAFAKGVEEYTRREKQIYHRTHKPSRRLAKAES